MARLETKQAPVALTPVSLDIALFGPLQVRMGGQPLQSLHSRKGQYLLALLTLRHNRPLERAWLAGLLWPESTESQALFNLRQCLSNLRQALGSEATRLSSPTPHTLCLDLAGAAADVVAFDEAIRRGDIASLEQAVALYRGPLLEGCLEEWVLPERQAREQAYLSALEKLAEQALQAQDAVRAAGYWRQVIATDPLRESAQRGLLSALAASGDYAAAVQVYRELRQLLHRELNAEPAAETKAVFELVRQQARTQAQSRVKPGAAAVPETSAPVIMPVSALEPETLGDLGISSSVTVTLLFTDIVGSTSLWEQHPDEMRQALRRHDALLRQAIEANQGQVFKTVGDAFCAVFATAAEALAAAVAAQQALQSEPWPLEVVLQVRTALHSGTVEQREGDYFGTTVNRVARLLGIGHGGQILLSAATQELLGGKLPEQVSLRDLGRHQLNGVEQPMLVYAVLHPDLTQEFPPLRSLDTLPHNLPLQLTSFIGREQEFEEVQQRLARSRLLTLTGAGGCGKTRLALQVAEQVVEDYPDGVWLVELAALSDPNLVSQSVVSALRLREEPGRSLTQTLVEYLKARKVLLLLDNCEHLLQACAQLVETLLRACPSLKLLVTSREPLQAAGEQPWRVPPLRMPPSADLPLEEKEVAGVLLDYDAVRLFVERAREQRPEFVLDRANAFVVARLCRRLDGIPLALELAAARVRAMPVEQIEARLEDCFRLLTGGRRTALPRQQTLKATLDWSYDLLNEQEQYLLQRLSVFAGGWTLGAAEQVCSDGNMEAWEVLDLLTSLVDKSLVGYEEAGGSARYRLLETIRQYAAEKLGSGTEKERVSAYHRDYFLALAEEAEPQLRGPEQAVWLDRLEVEHDNLRAALQWRQAEEDGAEAGLRLAGAFVRFWEVRGDLSEGRMYLEEVLKREKAAGRTKVWAKALNGAGILAYRQGDCEAAKALYEQSLAIERELDNKQGISASLNNLGNVAKVQGEYGTAKALYEESLSIQRKLGGRWGTATSLMNLGNVASIQGDYVAAKALYQEALAINREMGNKQGIANSLNCLGSVAHDQGEYRAARTLYEESLSIRRELGDKQGIGESLNNLGNVAMEQGDYEVARALHEQSLAIEQELGNKQGIAYSLMNLGTIAKNQSDYAEAKVRFEESLVVRRELGDKLGIAYSLNSLGLIAYEQGHYAVAKTLHEESLAIKQELGNKQGIANSLNNLGNVAYDQGDYRPAKALHGEGLAIQWELGNKRAIASALEAFGRLARVESKPERAARLWGAAEALREAINTLRPPNEREEYERDLTAARTVLGEEAFAAAWAEGRAMTVEQAVEYALETSQT